MCDEEEAEAKEENDLITITEVHPFFASLVVVYSESSSKFDLVTCCTTEKESFRSVKLMVM